MVELAGQKCVACRPDAPPVTDAEIAEFGSLIPEWKLIEEEGIRKLDRTFRFKDFAGALAFTDAIGALAEEEGHHPRLITEWGRVQVTWWSHEIKNLHRNDFIMSAKTDHIFAGPLGAGPS